MTTIKRHFIFSCLGDLLDIKKTKEYKDVQPSHFCLERRTIGKLARHYTTRGSLKVLTPPEPQEKANGLQDQEVLQHRESRARYPSSLTSPGNSQK